MAEVSSCKHCRSDALLVLAEENAVVCENCGMVLAETRLSEELEFVERSGRGQAPAGQYSSPLSPRPHPSSSQFVDANAVYDRSERQRRRVWRLVEHHGSALCLTKELIHHVKLVILQLTDSFRVRYYNSKWLVPASIYSVSRLRRHPLTLMDVAYACEVNAVLLARCYNRLTDKHPDLLRTASADPASFVSCIATQLIRDSNLSVNDALYPLRNLAIYRAIQLVCLAKSHWLVTGRRPNAVAGAALWVAVRAHDDLRVYGRLEELAEILKISVKTLRARVRELMSLLLEVGRSLPWGEQITIKSLEEHLTPIFQYLDLRGQRAGSPRAVIRCDRPESSYLAGSSKRFRFEFGACGPSSSRGVNPPCLQASIDRVEDRRLRLARARVRLSRLLKRPSEDSAQVNDEVSLDREDLILEKLLLLKVPASRILDCSNLGSLLELAESSDSIWLNDSAQVREYLRTGEEIRAIVENEEIGNF